MRNMNSDVLEIICNIIIIILIILIVASNVAKSREAIRNCERNGGTIIKENGIKKCVIKTRGGF